jgi:RNA polymerase sigma factor (sigma-70 family)
MGTASIQCFCYINLVTLTPEMPERNDDIERKHWEGLRNSDATSLEWLYNCYFRLLYNYGKKLSVDDRSLEDGIHDLFVDLWRFRKNLSPTSSVRFYLYRSLRRRLIRNDSYAKQLRHMVTLPEYLESHAPCEEQDIIEKEAQTGRSNQLKKLLADLSPRQYEAMVLRFYDELSFEEIGAILNVNEQSARNLVQRGVSQLKQFSRFLMLFFVFLG